MDELVKRFDAVADKDLMIAEGRGVAYQRDMTRPIEYGEQYFQNYVNLEDQEIARKLNAGRVGLVNKHAGADFEVLDVGVGSGEFIKNRPNTFGRDVNPVAIEWLQEQGKHREDFGEFKAFTFWDVLEHVDVPNNYFKRMPENCFLFTSLPIFSNLRKVRKSRHYKPNEHFYYWTEAGFIDWMAQYRFRLLESSTFETEAGRDNIGSFAFKRDLPSYRQTVDQYKELHSKAYGATAYLYFDAIAREVLSLKPTSILDFGCGRSDLVAHFWNDGARTVAKYDPAIPLYKRMPHERFDLVLCTDVMEHIPMADIGAILATIRQKAWRALFTISLIPARAELPDGRNAHVSLLTESEWTRWIASVFGRATRIRTKWDHILMLKTF